MTFFKVDDGMWGHPKFDDISDAALALWVRAGSWSARYLTNGVVPTSKLPVLRGTVDAANELVRAGLWREIKVGYRFHDWEKFQDSKAEVEKRRERWREVKRGQRSTKSNGNQEMSRVDSSLDSCVDSTVESGVESLAHSDPIYRTKLGGVFDDLTTSGIRHVEVVSDGELAARNLEALRAASADQSEAPTDAGHPPSRANWAARSRDDRLAREVEAFDLVTGTRRSC